MFFLKLCGFWCSGERNDVADVLHSGHEEDEALEAEAETGVGTGSPAAGVEIPPEMGLVHLATSDFGEELGVALFTDRATDDLSDLGEEDVGALHGGAGGDRAAVAY